MQPAGKDGNDSRSAARDGSLPRRRHQPKRRSPAPGRESPMPRWQCPDGTLVPGTHRQVPPGCLPAPPARYSDGRHPTPVSRRRRRTPEAERSPIGLRGAYVRAGPPGSERGGWRGCGERRGMSRPSAACAGALLCAAFAVKAADSVLSPAVAFCKRLMERYFSCGKI
ncbi:hypothetical protein DV515_00001739 [Chloebia gouldiae]|uniref:Uncharacterized protein n=1 Tax=Chloebia gouldiae TaxID=44316 RepID=A0A3L8SZA5_CHLGU|nr:hypothetical protein DV515_00001739 [Chloebia gouldiae]